MRRLHRAHGRPSDPLLHHARVVGGRRQGRDPRRPRHAGQAASAADRLHRRAGPTMRLLHQRLDHDGRLIPRDQEKADGRRNQIRARRDQVPLRHACQHPQGGQARRRDDGLRESIMTKMEKPTMLSRRAVLMGAGALVVSVGAPIGVELLAGLNQAFAQGAKPPLTPEQLSSYIAINADGTVSAFFGKMDMGHGLFVAIGQIVAEELDVPFKAVKVYMGDTATSVNQGGASGSTGIQFGGKQMRMAAAEARRVLLEMASTELATPVERLKVTDGIITVFGGHDDMAKSTSYAKLIGGKYFNVQLDWNKQMGNALYAPGKAQPKPFKDHKIIG